MVAASKIIEALKVLDYSKYPHNVILSELRKIGKAGMVVYTLHPKSEIIRVRPNYENEEERRFSNISQLSFRPQECNKKYQRASTPNKTMFYGSSTQKEIPGVNPCIGRKTAIFEVFPKLSDKDSEFSQKVTFSKWTVTENIKLAQICFDKNFHKNFLDHKYVYDKFVKYLDDYPEYKERTLEINSFLAQEFSNPKPNASKNYLYMISAIYSEMVSEYHLEGVSYPSVRTIGEGINVAINPKTLIANKLICSSVGESIIVKKKNYVAEIHDTETIILKKGQSNFQFKL